MNCQTCNRHVGIKAHEEYVQLFKWAVALRTPGGILKTVAIESILCRLFLALIDEQAIRKFILHSDQSRAPDSLLVRFVYILPCKTLADEPQVWVFTPDVKYSAPNLTAVRAIKVFYKLYGRSTGQSANKELKFEEIQLPLDAIRTILKSLEKSTSLLPPTARTHQDWKIGLLDR